jgi:hypothetical protein
MPGAQETVRMGKERGGKTALGGYTRGAAGARTGMPGAAATTRK